MALICFEGFNRTPRPDFWTLVPNGSGGDTPSTNAGGRNSTTGLGLSMSNFNAGVSLPKAVLTIPNQIDNYLYMGFATNGWTTLRTTHSFSNSNPASSINTNANKYVTVYLSNGTELFSVYFDNAAVESADTAGIAIKRGSTLLGRFLITPATNTSSATVQGEQTITSCNAWGCSTFASYAGLSGWQYLEFNILISSVNSWVAMRRNGMQVFDSGGNPEINLGSYNSLRDIVFWSPPPGIGGWSMDDFYIVDDAPSLSGYLGVDTHVHSPTFSNGMELIQEWRGNAGETINLFSNKLSTDDYDVTHIRTQELNKIAASKIDITTAANSLVGGITMSSRARAVTRASAYKHVFVDAATLTAHDLSPRFSLNGTNYGDKVYTTSVINPATTAAWTLADIDNAGGFGVKSVDPD